MLFLPSTFLLRTLLMVPILHPIPVCLLEIFFLLNLSQYFLYLCLVCFLFLKHSGFATREYLDQPFPLTSGQMWEQRYMHGTFRKSVGLGWTAHYVWGQVGDQQQTEVWGISGAPGGQWLAKSRRVGPGTVGEVSALLTTELRILLERENLCVLPFVHLQRQKHKRLSYSRLYQELHELNKPH